MGDNLAQELYRAFCNASGLVAGSGDVPNWASMPSSQREVWEQVATKARNEMAARFVAELDRVTPARDTPVSEMQAVIGALDVLRARWGR